MPRRSRTAHRPQTSRSGSLRHRLCSALNAGCPLHQPRRSCLSPPTAGPGTWSERLRCKAQSQPSDLDRLIDDGHRRTDRDSVIKLPHHRNTCGCNRGWLACRSRNPCWSYTRYFDQPRYIARSPSGLSGPGGTADRQVRVVIPRRGCRKPGRIHLLSDDRGSAGRGGMVVRPIPTGKERSSLPSS